MPTALAAIILPTCKPCSASGTALPTITSSILLGSNCGTDASKPCITSIAKSSGLVNLKPPLLDLPTAVLKPAIMYASCIKNVLKFEDDLPCYHNYNNQTD